MGVTLLHPVCIVVYAFSCYTPCFASNEEDHVLVYGWGQETLTNVFSSRTEQNRRAIVNRWSTLTSARVWLNNNTCMWIIVVMQCRKWESVRPLSMHGIASVSFDHLYGHSLHFLCNVWLYRCPLIYLQWEFVILLLMHESSINRVTSRMVTLYILLKWRGLA
jgi:hypothetical protein